MKKLLTIAVLMLWHVCGFAQTVEIRGVLKPAINKVAYLFQIEDGEPKLIKSASATSDGSFVLSFDPPYEGFYVIGGFTAMAGQFPLYLKKGDKAEVIIERSKMEFTGQQTEENVVLSSWSKLAQDQKADFQKNIHTKNAKFNILMKKFTGFEMDFYALNAIKKNPAAEEGKMLVVKDKFKNDDVFLYPNGKALIGMYADYAAKLNNTESGIDFLTTDRQKGTYIFNKLSNQLKTYTQFEEMTNSYGKFFQYPSLKAKVDGLGAKLYNATPGRKGSNFTFPDQNGKMVSLSDFKGKVVLVDVWATFCIPCRALFPALNKLEAELHNQEIVFISVAQDGPKGKPTWLKVIKDNKLGGVQLFAGGGNNVLANDYKIKAMPRYLIFDRQGNVVTTEAPLPNNQELKKMLLVELAK